MTENIKIHKKLIILQLFVDLFVRARGENESLCMIEHFGIIHFSFSWRQYLKKKKWSYR